MKKFFSILIAFVACSALFSANAGTLTFNCNHDDAAYIQYYSYENYQTVQHNVDLVDGSITIEGTTAWQYFYLYSKNDYIINASLVEGNVQVNYSTSYWGICPMSADTDGVIDVVAKTADEAYTSTVYITVDDPTAVNLQFTGTYRTITIDEANVEQAVKFNPDQETGVQFSSTNYYKQLYSATLDGEDLLISDYTTANITDGSHLDIKANYPEGNGHVSFVYGEGAEGFITSVTVDGTAIEDFSNGFDAALGSLVYLYCNTTTYNYEDLTINGNSYGYIYSFASFVVSKDTEIGVYAHPYGNISVNLNLDNPDAVTVYRGASYYNDVVTDLVAGDNTVELNEKQATLCLGIKDGYAFVSVTDGTTEYSYTNATYVSVYNLVEGANVTVTTKELGNIHVTIDVDTPENVTAYRGYTYNNNVIELAAGENDVEISEGTTVIGFVINDGCYFTSINDGTTEYVSNGTKSAYVYSPTDGMHITVRTGVINRDKRLVLYIDDKDALAEGQTYSSFNVQNYDGSCKYDLQNGYNEIYFYDGDNNFYFNWYNKPCNHLYVNDEVFEPAWAGATYYTPSFEDGDVAKVYVAKDPETCEVYFEISPEVGGDFEAYKDLYTAITNFSEAVSVLEDTQFDIVGENLLVRVNDETVESTDGSFTFAVTGATTVKIGTATGIENLLNSSVNDGAVYNLQGIKVLDNASDKSQLPAGLYISNGQKFINK